MKKMNSKTTAIYKANELIKKEPVFIDTETTGLDESAEIVEITIIDLTGNVLLDLLVKSKNKIPPDATKTHNITNNMVKDAPRWKEIWPRVASIIKNRVVGIYNAEYDIRLMKQSSRINGIDWEQPYKESFCVMRLFSEYFGEWDDYHGDYKWHKLSEAGRHCHIDIENTHRAKEDTFLARAIFFHIASQNPDSYSKQSNQDINDLKNRINLGQDDFAGDDFSHADVRGNTL